MHLSYATLLSEILNLSRQLTTTKLLTHYLTVLSRFYDGHSAGIILTNLENTKFERCAYLSEQTLTWLEFDPVNTDCDSNILSFSLSTGQKKVVTQAAFTNALGVRLPVVGSGASCVIMQPLAFAGIFGVAFVLTNSGVDGVGPIDPDTTDLSEHFAICFAALSKLKAQGERILQLEAKLSKEAQVNHLHVKRNQRLIEESLVGRSPKMQSLRTSIQRIASSNFNVLIRGETGTGKELVAREIHRLSPQFSGKFIAQNCAAIPLDLLESELFGHEKGSFTGADSKKEGLLAAADNGVLFLDEVGDMPMSLQSKLLRVLQERVYRPVGSIKEKQACFRLVAATHQPLEEMVKAGTFRGDLFYRLNESLIQVPTLAERQSDIQALSLHFIKQYEADNSAIRILLADEALAPLKAYHFPGNVRELRNIIRQCCLYADERNQISQSVVDTVLASNCLPAPTIGIDTTNYEGIGELKASCEKFELTLIRKALNSTDGDRAEAAKQLAVPIRTLAHKCQKYGL